MEGADMVIPPLFRCPISLDLFEDPVTLSTGQTYDRYCIEKWLAQGNLTCPVTMQKLDDFSMVPNHTLRHLIENWLSFGGQSEPDCFELTDADFSVAAAKQILESDESTLENKLQVIEKVLGLSQELPLKNYCLIKLDFFGVLLELVLKLHFELSVTVVEKALFCVLKLMVFSDLRTLNMLQETSKYEEFLSLFEQGNMVTKKSLCLVVEAISSGLETWELCKMLGKSVRLVREIVLLVKNKSEATEAGIRAVSALSQMKPNCENLVREGAVEGLIEYILNVEKQQERNLAPMAMSTIENLLAVENAKGAIISHPSGVNIIVKMVFRVSDHEGSESAVNSLLILCSDSIVARESAIFHGVLIQLLLLLQSQCSGRTKARARMLLKLIRSMWNEDPNHAW